MPQLPQPTTIRDHVDFCAREIAALTDRMNALAQELEWLADSINPRLTPMPDLEEAAA